MAGIRARLWPRPLPASGLERLCFQGLLESSKGRQALRKAPAQSPQQLGGCPLRTVGLRLNGLICIKVLLTILGLGEQIYYF